MTGLNFFFSTSVQSLFEIWYLRMHHSLVGCQLKHSEASLSGQQEKESKIWEEKRINFALHMLESVS